MKCCRGQGGQEALSAGHWAGRNWAGWAQWRAWSRRPGGPPSPCTAAAGAMHGAMWNSGAGYTAIHGRRQPASQPPRGPLCSGAPLALLRCLCTGVRQHKLPAGETGAWRQAGTGPHAPPATPLARAAPPRPGPPRPAAPPPPTCSTSACSSWDVYTARWPPSRLQPLVPDVKSDRLVAYWNVLLVVGVV
jgi:hypothetical protein